MKSNEIRMIAQAAFMRNQINAIIERVEREHPEDEEAKKQREAEAFMQPVAFPGDLTDVTEASVTIHGVGSKIVSVEPSLIFTEEGELQTILRPTGIIFDANQKQKESPIEEPKPFGDIMNW